MMLLMSRLKKISCPKNASRVVSVMFEMVNLEVKLYTLDVL